jgi:trehalose synthase
MLEKQEANGSGSNSRNQSLDATRPKGTASAPLAFERRKKPRTQIHVQQPPSLKDYAPLISEAELDEMRVLAGALEGRAARLVSAKPIPPESLDALTQSARLFAELGLPFSLDIPRSRPAPEALSSPMLSGLQSRRNDKAERRSKGDGDTHNSATWDEDFILLRELTPVASMESKGKKDQVWIWSRIYDSYLRVAEKWEEVRPLAEKCDAAVIPAAAFAGPLNIPQYVFYPSVDPLSDRNRPLEPSEIEKVCAKYKLDRSRPMVSQIAPFERASGQLEILHAYKLAKRYIDCQLILAGAAPGDNAEAQSVVNECLQAASADRDIRVLRLAPPLPLELNAIERAATIIVQTPTRDAFGLAVAEALWKAKPVIASAVGSISNQVIHKSTGALVHSVEGCAYQLRYLLTNPEIAEQMGKNGREHVKENFLITSHITRWLVLFQLLRAATGVR